jgi:TRAP transporter TAXI family solute receptor
MGPMRNMRNVTTGYGLAFGFHFIDPKVKTIRDMKGKSLFVQVMHHDHVTATKAMLEAVGLTYDKDVKIIPVRSPNEAIQGLMTARGDGLAYGAVPGLAQVKQAKGLHTVPIPPAILTKIQQAEPSWGTTTIKAGRGPLKPEADVPVLELGCGISAGTHTSADTVYAVLKAIYEHHDEWKAVHPLARQWSIQKGVQTVVQPFHDGAVRFYKEKGVWTAELEARQKAMLAK